MCSSRKDIGGVMDRCEARASSIMGVIGTEGGNYKCGVCGDDPMMAVEVEAAKKAWLEWQSFPF